METETENENEPDFRATWFPQVPTYNKYREAIRDSVILVRRTNERTRHCDVSHVVDANRMASIVSVDISCDWLCDLSTRPLTDRARTRVFVCLGTL